MAFDFSMGHFHSVAIDMTNFTELFRGVTIHNPAFKPCVLELLPDHSAVSANGDRWCGWFAWCGRGRRETMRPIACEACVDVGLDATLGSVVTLGRFVDLGSSGGDPK